MNRDLTNVGLCTYCAAAPACSFLKASGPPIVQCEEFKNLFKPTAVRPCGKRVAGRSIEGLPYTDTKNPASPRTGLCGNCENCASCVLAKDEGGVWRCEEYQ